MNELEDQDDPDDPDPIGGEYATTEEVAAALRGLGLDLGELTRIEAVARVFAFGSTLEYGELLNTAIVRLLAGQRHWHRKETIAQCLKRTMYSIVQDWWRRKEIETIPEADADFLEDDDGGEVGVIDLAASDAPNAERLLIAREALGAVRGALEDDKHTWEIAEAIALGETPADICYAFELTETKYDSAVKRIWRRLNKIRAVGDRK